MISIKKLYSLPRKLRLRKSALILLGYEKGLGEPKSEETEGRYGDRSFIEELCVRIEEEFGIKVDGNNLHRRINAIRHYLKKEVGADAAEWDMLPPLYQQNTETDQYSRTRLPLGLYLEDIRSPYNIGALIRTAAAFCLKEVVLSPLCPTPEHTRASRSAMGSEKIIPWRFASLDETLSLYQFRVALELGGTALSDFTLPSGGGDNGTLLMLGGEELGLSSEALGHANGGRLTIPLYGFKASLNVAVAGGIAIHALSGLLKSSYRNLYKV